MRLPAFLVLVLCFGQVSFGQIFPRAPWNKSSVQSGCYTDANGNQVCPSSVTTVETVAPVVRPFRYPSVSSTTYSYPSVSYGSSGSSVVSGGSSGSMVYHESQPSEASVSILRRNDFRKSLMEAARSARQKGEIDAAQFFKIAAMSRIPKVAANLEAAIHEAAIEEGIATANAIDWDAIIEFIERLIPLILKLIDLFS